MFPVEDLKDKATYILLHNEGLDDKTAMKFAALALTGELLANAEHIGAPPALVASLRSSLKVQMDSLYPANQ